MDLAMILRRLIGKFGPAQTGRDAQYQSVTGWKPIPREEDMNLDGVFRRRHLPHWDVEGKPFFITACLEGSISSLGINRIRKYRTELDARPRPENLSPSDWEHHKDKLVFAVVDDLLD